MVTKHSSNPLNKDNNMTTLSEKAINNGDLFTYIFMVNAHTIAKRSDRVAHRRLTKESTVVTTTVTKIFQATNEDDAHDMLEAWFLKETSYASITITSTSRLGDELITRTEIQVPPT